MPRLPRIDVAGIAQHIVQRGNNRLPCFLAEGDYIRYRDDLRELALKFECSVHAYLLMTNPVHLLMTPAHEGLIVRVMQGLGRRFVRARLTEVRINAKRPKPCLSGCCSGDVKSGVRCRV